MNLEIERKFLVKGEFKQFAVKSYRIAQGYLCKNNLNTVRVRIRDKEGFITIKGPSRDGGITRFEWEKSIPFEDAVQLLALSVTPVIDKVRYIVPFAGHDWEVDEFHGANEGLIVAEIELADAGETFELPGWVADEVTSDRRYTNLQLSLHPYKEFVNHD